MKAYNVAVLGATGLVGGTILKILEERDFPINHLYLFSSKKSAGSLVTFKGKEYQVQELKEDSFTEDMDFAFFAAGGAISEKYAQLAIDKGVKVIDNSSVFRMKDGVPLVVPEVNPEEAFRDSGIISNPNCSTIQSVVPLKPLHDRFKIKRIVFSTYQAVSGSGIGGLNDLEKGQVEFYPHQIQANALPHIDSFLDDGYTKEEMKMVNETRKILNDDSIRITATTVRIPVRYSHCVSANVEFEKPFELEELYAGLENFEGIVVKDDVNNNVYPMPLDAEGTDQVYVGRIRRDFSVENGVNLWIVADNIRKGAATNAVQIAELLINR